MRGSTARPANSAAALLARLPPFRGVSRTQLGELAGRAQRRQAQAGELIVRRGERVPGLLVVQSGLVKLSIKGESERVLRLVAPGETFGEAALILDQPLLVDAGAVTPTDLVIVPAEPILSLFERDARFARALLVTVCQRLQAVVADFESAVVHGAAERLAAYICSLGKETASLPAPKAVIASRLGMTKETLSRLLRTFIDQGLISVAKREIRVLDRAQLHATARGQERS
jgi:CRP-like cAMP-binding protein